MPKPTNEEIENKKKQFEEHKKKLDEEGRIREEVAVQMVRSALRQVWLRAPNKLALREATRIPDLDPTTRTKWLWECSHCHKLFKQADIEVDHKEGNHSFLRIDDFKEYFNNILNASYLTALQILCIPCHEIKTYAEKHNISLEEARKRKEVIAKLNLPAGKQKEYLIAKGYKASEISNKDRREALFNELLDKDLLD